MKHKIQKIFALAALALTVAMSDITTDSLTVHAAETVYNLGDSVIGTLSEDGVLTISGTGEITTTLSNAGVESIYAVTSLVINSGIKGICSNAFAEFSQITGDVVIPYGVTSIGDSAFMNCTGISSITIPNSVSYIGLKAFYNCSGLESVTIPNSVTTIGSEAFAGCNNVTTFKIGSGVSSIGTYAFNIIMGSRVNTTVYTNNDKVKSFSWSSNSRNVTFSDLDESDEAISGGGSGSGSGDEGSGSGSTESNSEQSSLTVTGTVQAITTMDITLPLNGITFNIDSDRNFTGNTSTIKSNSNFPIEVYLGSISRKLGTEPEIVANDKYSESGWDNLSKEDTLAYMAISINNKNLSGIYNNTEMDANKMIGLGLISSAFSSEQTFDLVPSAFYGKNFGNKDTLSFEYDLVIEFRIP